MTKTANLIIGLVVILAVGGVVFMQYSSRQAAMQPADGSEQGQDIDQETNDAGDDGGAAPASGTGRFALADVSKHKDSASCWSAINGGVYDLTSWIPQHPGGPQAILSICGIDGSSRFNARHGGAALQAKILAGFKIGTLSK